MIYTYTVKTENWRMRTILFTRLLREAADLVVRDCRENSGVASYWELHQMKPRHHPELEDIPAPGSGYPGLECPVQTSPGQAYPGRALFAPASLVQASLALACMVACKESHGVWRRTGRYKATLDGDLPVHAPSRNVLADPATVAVPGNEVVYAVGAVLRKSAAQVLWRILADATAARDRCSKAGDLLVVATDGKDAYACLHEMGTSALCGGAGDRPPALLGPYEFAHLELEFEGNEHMNEAGRHVDGQQAAHETVLGEDLERTFEEGVATEVVAGFPLQLEVSFGALYQRCSSVLSFSSQGISASCLFQSGRNL